MTFEFITSRTEGRVGIVTLNRPKQLNALNDGLMNELGERDIRVFAVSPGPLRTRAASGIAHFDELIDMAVARSPGRRLVDIAEVGRVVAFLVGGAASGMTGDVIYVDAGLHIVA